MGYSRSQAPPMTEQDLCKPKFSLLVEKVRSSLITTQLMRLDMLDGESPSLMNICGHTLKPSKERRKRETKEGFPEIPVSDGREVRRV